MTDGWMTEQEAAKYLGLSDATLKRLRYEGAGPSYGKPGKTALYKREDLDAWVRGKPEEPLVAVELRPAAAGEPGAVWIDVNDYGAPGVDAKGVIASTLMPADDFVAWAECTVAPMVEKVKGQMGGGVKP